MAYQFVAPPPALAAYVQAIWYLETPVSQVSAPTFRVLADGCPGLIFQQSESGSFYQYEKPLPALYLYGPATQYTQLQFPGSFRVIGFCFYPHALKTLFQLDASALTDRCLGLEEMSIPQTQHLPEQLMHQATVFNQIELLSASLMQRLQQTSTTPDPTLHQALQLIHKQKGDVSMKELQQQTGLSERSLERRFKHYVGLSPKLWSSIYRFQSSVEQLNHNRYAKLSDVAFDRGYADQSHFIRAFRTFAGLSPQAYLRDNQQILGNFSSSPF
ncbi:AraC family transcriptional regulator [Siphonobacter sp. BAB-5385]|uniref:helix-turn-helix domain-containing protein n=1 Tax=Siphonobacter sp. BAB-5385 TaxID=1864822 RepID=UPI000B9DE4DC|nr:helix-turn-helix domain-containing protein [Siphonobacter sp. BAB-5385]OZI07321.1 AraC family transcriptional regulator [Siphonobacter sp. BAB-5385]